LNEHWIKQTITNTTRPRTSQQKYGRAIQISLKNTKENSMPYINVGKENSGNIDLYYEDHGTGRTSRCVTHNSGPSEEGTPRSPSHFQVRSEPIKKEHASYRPRIVSLRRLLWQRADLRDVVNGKSGLNRGFFSVRINFQVPIETEIAEHCYAQRCISRSDLLKSGPRHDE